MSFRWCWLADVCTKFCHSIGPETGGLARAAGEGGVLLCRLLCTLFSVLATCLLLLPLPLSGEAISIVYMYLAVYFVKTTSGVTVLMCSPNDRTFIALSVDGESFCSHPTGYWSKPERQEQDTLPGEGPPSATLDASDGHARLTSSFLGHAAFLHSGGGLNRAVSYVRFAMRAKVGRQTYAIACPRQIENNSLTQGSRKS